MSKIAVNCCKSVAKLQNVFVISIGLTALTIARYSQAFSDDLPINRFATKNSYSASFTRFESPQLGRLNSHYYKPAQVIGLFRHGTRYPGKKDITGSSKIFTDLQKLNVSQSTLDHLRSVLDAFPLANATQLAPAGAVELWNLGKRFAEKYSRLFDSAVHDDISFVTSGSARAVDSGESFQRGFATVIENKNLSWPIHQRNDLLRFFAECPRYLNGVRYNHTALFEFYDFSATIHDEVVQQMAQRLDVAKLNLTEKDLFSMYQFAAIEYAVLGTTYWGSLFSSESLTALEYAADLQEYWKMGYGYPINYQISCPLISDIFKHFDDRVKEKSYKKGVFYFGHAETLVPVLVALGLFNDGFPLTAADFGSEASVNRTFCVSRISPFAGNLALVLHDTHEASSQTGFEYEAADSGNSSAFDSAERYMLEVLVNEMPVKLPFAYRHLWPYSEVRRKYEAYIDRCNFKRLCNEDGLESAASSATSNVL